MIYFVGTDEAGYGPNLGPLVVAASVWKIADSAIRPADLYARLSACLQDSLPKNDRGRVSPTQPIVIADSKTLYHSGQGLQHLERGIFSLFGNLSSPPETWRELFEIWAATSQRPADASPEYQGYDAPALTATTPDQIAATSQFLRQSLQQAGVELVRLEADLLFPQRFNELVTARGSKGAVLTETTLALVRRVTQGLPPAPLWIRCDKHGGRARYAPALQDCFPDEIVRVCEEGRQASRYEWGASNRRVQIEFVAKGEGFMPTALASMLAKYLRERSMEAVNAFWSGQVPGLRPTAGYPVDARRFWSETATLRQQLGIPDHVLWRQQ